MFFKRINLFFNKYDNQSSLKNLNYMIHAIQTGADK